MHLPRRSVFATMLALCLAVMTGSIAAARTTAPNPVAVGFRARSVAFFDADHGIVTGTIVCHTCMTRHTAAISTTADGGRTWSAPVTFGPAVATDATVVPGGQDAWASVGRRLAHSGDGGATWTMLPRSHVSDPSFADAMDGWAIRRAAATTAVVATDDGGVTWSAIASPCRRGAKIPLFVTRTTTDHGWVVCGGNPGAGSLLQTVWRTADGGTSWTRESHAVAPGPVGYRFLDDGHGWRWHYVFADLFRTTDAGATWHDLGPVANAFVADVWFVSDTDGFALVQPGNGSSRLFASTDGGSSWSSVVRFPAT